MTDAPDHFSNDRRHLEFTPIGYSRQNPLKRLSRSPTQTLAEDDNDEHKISDEGPSKKLRRTDLDDTMASNRMFNDSSQFDDTLPQLNEQPAENYNKSANGSGKETDDVVKNLMGNLEENAPASNPLKEQQEQLHKLNTDNYNLRLKCNSLLKFLHSVTDQGELTKSLGLLDEINEWKQKHYALNQQYLELKTKLIQLEANAAENKQEPVTEADHTACHRELSYLKNQLEKTTLQLNTYRDEVAHLEEKTLRIQEGERAKEEQHQLELQMLKSDVNNLNVSLVNKETELEEDRAKIQRLTNQLHEFDHKGSQSLLDLERQLEMKRDSISSLEKEVRALTHDRVQIESRIKEKEIENAKLQSDLERLRNSVKDRGASNFEIAKLKNSKATLDDKVRSLTEERQRLNQRISDLRKDCDEWKTKYQRNESLDLDQQKAFHSLRQELQIAKTQLEETRKTAQQLQTQVIENTTKSSERTSQRIKDKEIHIQRLESELQSYRQQLKEGSRRLQVEEERCREVYESELQNLEMKNGFEKTKLEREINLLKEEKVALIDTHDRELELWKNKFDALNKENDRLVRQEINDLDGVKRKLNQQLDKLQEKLTAAESDRGELADKLVKLQHSKDSYKDELKRVSSKLEYLSKEYLKFKQSAITDEEQKTKYNTMKQRLLVELKSLQDENLSLERKLLEQRGNSSRSQESSSRSNTSTQDRLDYYKLKYNNEVKHNNDLRIMNDYLNRVLRAGSQHLKLDLLKLESEISQSAIPSSRTYKTFLNDDRYRPRFRRGLISPGYIPSFKAVALLVLACVRMKQTAIRCRWDEHRIRYLKNKMAMDDDRITW
ncbi:hypothetical protein ZYGR_0AS04100 [Zygosaccharomyces rouxii]|uniref:Spindle pole body component 110 n=1 Tax=Zygosaccharomyces rouxii TaxID=4956 RepID=A0A1Q3AH69_ZYGRO|nr:hypothetical protein ZYGR_0AS04100 [Zygosaccharomyces rouxii]